MSSCVHFGAPVAGWRYDSYDIMNEPELSVMLCSEVFIMFVKKKLTSSLGVKHVAKAG